MKISVAVPVLDLAPPASTSPADTGAAGRGFETAVRAVAERAGDRAGAPAGSPLPPPERERVPEGRKDAAAADKAPSSKKDEEKADDDKTQAEASATPTADLLGRLLAGSGLAAAAQGGRNAKDEAAKEGSAKLSVLSDADAAALAAAASAVANDGSEITTFDGALEERLVITPLGAGGTDGKAEGAGKNRTGVGLEVLHMETHFEPRVDDVVLVEGAVKTSPKDAGASGDALGGVLSTIRLGAGKSAGTTERAGAGETKDMPMRFDEALARLSNGESAADADASDRREAKDRRADAKVSDDARQGASRTRTEVAVDVETTVATPLASSMTSQIADRIVDAFRPSTGQERTPDAAPGSTHLRMTAGGAALKTLTIQLQPENLGKLEVSMRLIDGRLTLELAASSAETAVALAHDRAGLKKLLEHAGFSMDEASISIVARDSTAAMARTSGSPDAGGQGQQAASGDGRSGSDASSGGEQGFQRGSGSEAQDPSAGRRGRPQSAPQASERRGASIFL
ncbi:MULTISPECIES: flagellar hook-length control protein FliK [unclassified Aureimonas]|uniref:flagellar hook-length control protein FliK n=1 Tax=unclassified Aureimonas TaxID=2615206 RepID=UPI0006F3BF81|nr:MULTISPECIES: flagellar hook-length control protein FliK [unclassified Aureimonas]KQT66082.1 hypothetical protein ASG62_19925 [Aureimonas sp. Leaf427]KQT81054.1 hypothetical protein ASG54_06325 [Aureimonas sp. Leaf460]